MRGWRLEGGTRACLRPVDFGVASRRALHGNKDRGGRPPYLIAGTPAAPGLHPNGTVAPEGGPVKPRGRIPGESSFFHDFTGDFLKKLYIKDGCTISKIKKVGGIPSFFSFEISRKCFCRGSENLPES